jgi:hydrogenase nickel incorporation protein HypA/HybF
MHELSLMVDLIRKVESIALEQGASRVLGVKVRLGALSHISPDHLREHFAHASCGTAAEGAWLDVEVLSDATDPNAQEVILESVEVEKDGRI